MRTVLLKFAAGAMALVFFGAGVALAADPAPAAGAASASTGDAVKKSAKKTPQEKAAAKKAREAKKAEGTSAKGKKKAKSKSKGGAKSGSKKGADAKAKPPVKPAAPVRKPAPRPLPPKRPAPAPVPKLPPGSVELAPIAAPGQAVIGNELMTECLVQSGLPKAVAAGNAKVVLAPRPSRYGRVLTLKIVEFEGRSGGFFSGSKKMTVEGRLTEGGRTVGTFVAKQKATGSMSSCGMVNNAMTALGKDIGAWLDKPAMESKLGNAH